MGRSITKEKLAELLKEAEAAHAEYEKTLGYRDKDWPTGKDNIITVKGLYVIDDTPIAEA